jgi:hypothetical protein
MSSKKRNGYLFIALFIFLVVQYAAVGVVSLADREPWPALLFPGFKSVYEFNGGYEIDRTRFEVIVRESGKDESRVIRLSPFGLFPDLPKSQLGGFISMHFGSSGKIHAFSEETVEWLAIQAQEVTGIRPVQIDVVYETLHFPTGSVQADSVSVTFRTEIQVPQ